METLYRTLTGQSQKSQKSDHSAHAQPGLTRTTTTDPLTGSLNHLSESQLEQLDLFKQRLEKEGWWKPVAINGKPSHDDGTLLRYLRARKFDITGAVGQFSDTEKWLKEQRVEELYEHYDVELYERARLMYPQWTGHRDRRGIPIYVFVVKGLDSKHVSKYQKDAQAYKDKLPYHKSLATPAKLLPLFALYHNLLNFVLPMVSSLERPNPEIPVTNSTNIVDISGVGLTQFWNLKAHMQDASVLATAHYPETLDRIFIIGAPSFFPTVWGWIKRWFDPVTVSKIFILGKHEVQPTLAKFMDLKDVPKKYGGELDWQWGDVPHMDAESTKAVSTDGNSGWVRGPCLWLDHERIVVGSEDGKLRRPDSEVAEKKPVVYAADYTAEPVHPDRKASTISKGSTLAANGTATPSPPRPSSHAVDAVKIATASTAASTVATQGKAPIEEPPAPAEVSTSRPATGDIPQENLRASPIDGAMLNLPTHQPGHPAVTAEYISPVPSAKDTIDSNSTPKPEPKETVALPPPATDTTIAAAKPVEVKDSAVPAPADTSDHTATKASSSPSPPPGIPHPGPPSKHTVELTRAIAAKMEGESLSTIPASTNGHISHPEIILASDKSKGLAIEKEKLELERPVVERFLTAAEF